MESLTIRARSVASARAMITAVSGFRAELFCDGYRQYRVEVTLGSDREIVDVLNTLERYMNERQSGPALIGLNGHEYTMHPDPRPIEIIATPN